MLAGFESFWFVCAESRSAKQRLVCPTGQSLRSLDRGGLQLVAVHPSAEATASHGD